MHVLGNAFTLRTININGSASNTIDFKGTIQNGSGCEERSKSPGKARGKRVKRMVGMSRASESGHWKVADMRLIFDCDVNIIRKCYGCIRKS